MANTAFDLTGKTALVTGCNKGIGKAMALGLAEAGADIIGVYGSLELEGSAIEKEVMAIGRKFKAYQANLSKREAIYAFLDKLTAAQTVIDILVNNAGTIMRMPAANTRILIGIPLWPLTSMRLLYWQGRLAKR